MEMAIGHGTTMTMPPMHRGGRTTRHHRHRRVVLSYRPCHSSTVTYRTSSKTNTTVMRLPTSVVRRLHGTGRQCDCHSTTTYRINHNSPSITTTRNERRTLDRPCSTIGTEEERATPTSSREYFGQLRRHDEGGRDRSMLDMRGSSNNGRVGWWI